MSIHLSRVIFPSTKQKAAALVTFSNPGKRNALSPQMMTELGSVLDKVSHMASTDTELVAVILTGDNGSFCSGFDLSSKHSSSSTSSGENTFFTTAYALQMTALMHKNMLKLHRMDLVSIAAVDGFALGGGCELMAWCDLRVMSKEAKAGFLQTKMGVVTGWGGATRLRTMVSPSHALQLLSSPRIMNSKECFESKLATHIGDANSASSMDIVERDVFNRDWVDAYPLAIRNMKKLTQCGIAGDGIDLEKMLANEQRVFCGLWGGKDNIEAVANSKMKQPKKTSLL